MTNREITLLDLCFYAFQEPEKEKVCLLKQAVKIERANADIRKKKKRKQT